MHKVRVAADRWNFELVGTNRTISPYGGNMLSPQHPIKGTLFDHFDAAEADRRLGIMAAQGLNCLRQAIGVNQVFDPATGLKAAGMRNWDTFISLAEKHGIYLMPVGGYVGGNDWFDVEGLACNGHRLDESCAFFSAFATHYRNHPAIWSWDLRNELLYWNKPHFLVVGVAEAAAVETTIFDGWAQWLETKYGDVAMLNLAHGASYASFAAVPRQTEFIPAPFSPWAYDVRCYLNDRGYNWCKRHTDAIRAVDPNTMICSGNNTWMGPDMDLFLANGFHNRAVHELFDFVTHHPYPAWVCEPGMHGDPLDGGEALKFWLSCSIATSRYEHYGKPVVLQEFGWYGGGTSHFIGPLKERSEQEHADYTRTLIESLIPHTNGFINWPTFDMPEANDISNRGGIFTHDGRSKALTTVFADLARRESSRRQVRAPATTTLEFSLLGLYTSRPYQDAFWERCHAVISAGEVPDIRFIS